MLNIINQDRNEIIKCSTRRIYKMAIRFEGVLLGYNLYCGTKLLGTFDTAREAEQEECAIINCELDYYAVSGYSPGREDYPN